MNKIKKYSTMYRVKNMKKVQTDYKKEISFKVHKIETHTYKIVNIYF